MNGISVVALAAALALSLGAQTADPDEVLALSVEELLGTQVTSVSRKAQRLSRAPAAIFVMTQEDLRRTGATTVMEALRFVPGLQVAQLTGSEWAISARGQASRFSNKMLVLMDGRPLYNLFFSGVLWEFHDTLIEDIDRIEVIRGPGAVMWGANAVNGVINIITKSARQTQGVLVTAATGSQDHAVAGARYGFKTGDRGYMRVYGKFRQRETIDHTAESYRQNFNLNGGPFFTSLGKLPDHDWTSGRGGFRWDLETRRGDSWMLAGDVSQSWLDSTALYPVDSPPYVDLHRGYDHPRAANLIARWSRSSSKGVETTAQFFADRSQTDSTHIRYSRDTFDASFDQTRLLGESNEFFWGLNVRLNQDSVNDGGTVRFLPLQRRDPLYAVVLRDDWQIIPQRWLLSLGSRFEHNNYTGLEVQPSFRVLYTPSRRQSFWGAWSRAVRTPSRTETGIDTAYLATEFQGMPLVLQLRGNPHYKSEVLNGFEAGYRLQSGVKWSFDLALFHNRYSRLGWYRGEGPVLDRLSPPRLRLDWIPDNNRWARSYGGEVYGTWKIHPRLTVMPSYSHLIENIWDATPGHASAILQPRSSPRTQWKIRTWWDVTPRIQLDAAIFHICEMPAYDIGELSRLDFRATYRLTRRQELSLSWFDAGGSHLEYPPLGPFVAAAQKQSLLLKWVGRF